MTWRFIRVAPITAIRTSMPLHTLNTESGSTTKTNMYCCLYSNIFLWTSRYCYESNCSLKEGNICWILATKVSEKIYLFSFKYRISNLLYWELIFNVRENGCPHTRLANKQLFENKWFHFDYILCKYLAAIK